MARQRPKGVGPWPDGALLGRREEIATLDRSVAAARDGDSRVLVVAGAAGVGKSALLEHVARSSDDMRVLRAAGVESEMELAFAALHQLCMPCWTACSGSRARSVQPSRRCSGSVRGRRRIVSSWAWRC